MRIAKKMWTYCVIIVIAVVCAFTYELFVFPNHFAPAGLNGICTMIQYLSGISVGYLSLIINVPLAIWVFFSVSKPLAVRSMVYVVSFSVTMLLLEQIDMTSFVYYTENGTSSILGPLAAGIINGGCYALLVQASAYSGGVDFIAAIIHKSHPEKSFFWMIFYMNVCVALCSYFVYDFQIEPVLLCIMYCFMSSSVSERLTKGVRSAVRFEIITDYPQEISDAIINRLHHSATLIPGKGMYLGKEVSILVCIVNKTQIVPLSALIREYPHTFAVMSQVNEVMGNFTKINVHGQLEKQLLDKGDGNAV